MAPRGRATGAAANLMVQPVTRVMDRYRMSRAGACWRSAYVRGTLAIALVVGLSSIPTLAYANPSPTWLPNINDGVDYDDVVAVVTEEGAVEPPTLAPRFSSRAFLLPAPARASLLAFHLRSPPRA